MARTTRFAPGIVILAAACAGSPSSTETPTGAGGGSAAAGGPSEGAAAGATTSSGDTSSTSGGGASSTSAGTGGAQGPLTQAGMVAAGDVGRGAKLYEENHCGGCHGTKDKPGKKFPNLFKITWNDAEIAEAFTLVQKGKSPMPGFADKLDDKAIADMIAFLKANKQ